MNWFIPDCVLLHRNCVKSFLCHALVLCCCTGMGNDCRNYSAGKRYSQTTIEFSRQNKTEHIHIGGGVQSSVRNNAFNSCDGM